MVKIAPEKAVKVIVGMSNLLRSSLDNISSVITLKEDIEYTENYLMIQKLRFGNQLNYKFDVEDSALKCLVPKRIIQPLVENTLIHGVDSQNRCKLSIAACIEDGKLRIIIEDDGKGIDAGKLEEIDAILNQRINTSRHNGLFNVHRRIGLIFGEQYGLKIENRQSRGVRVTVYCRLSRRMTLIMTRVIVVEDEEYIRKGLVYTFNWSSAECVVVGEAEDGISGLKLIEQLSPTW